MRDRLFDVGPQLMLVTTFTSYIAINIDSCVFDTLHLIKIILQGYHSEFFIGIGFSKISCCLQQLQKTTVTVFWLFFRANGREGLSEKLDKR